MVQAKLFPQSIHLPGSTTSTSHATPGLTPSIATEATHGPNGTTYTAYTCIDRFGTRVWQISQWNLPSVHGPPIRKPPLLLDQGVGLGFILGFASLETLQNRGSLLLPTDSLFPIHNKHTHFQLLILLCYAGQALCHSRFLAHELHIVARKLPGLVSWRA